MNYKESNEIFNLIKKANRILLNCHKDPDPDSVGSALALYQILRNLGKETDVFCPSSVLFPKVSYLPFYDAISSGVDFSKINYKLYDYVISLDTSSPDRLTGSSELNKLPIEVFVIDHHRTNTRYGSINLVDENKTSTAEVLYDVFEDWNIDIGKNVADSLMAAIVGDTGAFRYPKLSVHTFEVVAKLIKLGADKDRAIFQIYGSEELSTLRFWSEVLSRIKINNIKKYAWSAVPYEDFEKCGKPINGKETAASNFIEIIEGTDFGFVAVEQEKNVLKISFRSRTGFDTSKLAMLFGGGGHIYASGASINNMDFDKAVKYLLSIIDRNC
jgi:bifunctional oligoribonuclease and PAP phosphatase NrnA